MLLLYNKFYDVIYFNQLIIFFINYFNYFINTLLKMFNFLSDSTIFNLIK